MTASSTEKQHAQVFRVYVAPGSLSASETTAINTQIDPETGQPIILWSDIHQVFKGAQHIRNNGRAVLFLNGKDLKKLDPPRISYHPGVVLEVVIESPEATSRPGMLSTSSTATPQLQPDSSKLTIDNTVSSTTGLADGIPAPTMTSLQISDLSIADTETSQNSLTLISPGINSEARRSVQALNQLYGSFLRAMTFGQEVSTIKKSMDKHFEDLKAEMEKNKTLEAQKARMQEQMTRMQEHMAEKQTEMLERQKEMQEEQQQMRQELSEKQQQILNMQEQALDMHKQALDHLAIIYGRLQAVLTQTYELHEYPIPRLFIILPKEMRFRNRLGKPFSDQFRLYFLCECGAHTMSEDNKIQHEIHLAKHEGYDIDRPTEFFQKYGAYILAMMQMIKYGVVVAGIVVPPLAHFKLFEGIEAVEKTLDVAKQDITPLVDETITYIKGQRNEVDVDSESSTTVTELDKLEVLEGSDLRQLESFLNIKDGGRVLGNLYRIVTLEGHVKWVCIDHYRENYREAAVQQLRDIVTANGGTFIEEKGSIEIRISSRTQAKEFYGALVQARGIQELDFKLGWDATLDDLRKFSDAITMANILGLTVDGGYFEGPALDVINRGRRYDPLIQLMSNGRLKTLRFKECRRFFSHVSTSLATKASQLQALEIEISWGDKEADVRRAMPKILESCHSLIHLTLSINDLWLSLDLVKGALSKMKKLETVIIRRGLFGMQFDWRHKIRDDEVIMRVSEGRVEAVEATFKSFEAIEKLEQEYIGEGLLTKVALGIDQWEAALFLDILRRNPLISNFQIECVTASVPSVIETVTSAQIARLEHGNASGSLKLEVVVSSSVIAAGVRILGLGVASALQKVGMLEDMSYSDGNGNCDIITSIVEFEGGSVLPETFINVKMDIGKWSDSRDHFNEVFSQYGSSIKKLEMGHTFNDEHAKFLDDATEKSGSRLVSLVVDPTSLTRSGLESVDRIVERSQNLEKLELKQDLNTSDQRENVEYLLSRLGKRLTDLSLRASYSSERWCPMLKKLCPTRQALPNLTAFRMSCVCDIPRSGVEWILAMSTPPPLQVSSPLSPLWRSLSKIQLQHIRLRREDWRALIEEIDITALEELDVSNSNFSLEEFKALANCIPDGIVSVVEVPLKVLNLQYSDVVECEDVEVLQDLATRIKTKNAPQLQILGLSGTC
ncbi:hypothetical protein EDD21DRAFT_222845 [Dissophora ornata]|nr:hypothetical protein BGZ58_008165 [Dissophora ornata]KAI8604367.1 hypothetical protein EDD21DRAFT_222845 [Dissophora ornata]